MEIYIIKSQNGEAHSHDWGGEFYYDENEAKERAAELSTYLDISEPKMSVIKATLYDHGKIKN
jgi:hypothetical protein